MIPTTLIDDFLAAQSTLTAVDRFASADPTTDSSGVPAQARWYRDLMPASPPGPGQQYAFRVDLDACSGCKACVTACHSLNGLDEGESWRTVGALVGTGDNALVQSVTTGCHHCADPGCLSGCPVDAYVKDDNGIVRHLDDQCIGCSYCTLTCPYEVPRFDDARGIVRKCDMCHDRLAVGEAPACVQACPTEAISIVTVDLDDVGTDDWGFAAPPPEATRPATVFASSRDLATDVAPVDRHTVTPRHAHPPLVVMLVLTQLSIGAFVVLEVLRASGAISGTSAGLGSVAALATTVVALLASLAHLGRPQYAFRAVIGLRHSWLSREIVAFGMFAPLGVLHAATIDGRWPASVLPAGLTGAAASGVGLLAVAASVMVYVRTGREGWGATEVTTRFALTTAALGTLAVLGVLAVGAWTDAAAGAGHRLAALGAGLVLASLVPDLWAGRSGGEATTRGRTAALRRGPLHGVVQVRVGFGLLAALLAASAAVVLDDAAPIDAGPSVVLALGALVAAVVTELAGRWCFFAAEGSPRMPGALS